VLTLESINSGALRPDFGWCDPAELLQEVGAGVDLAPGGQDRLRVTISLPDQWGPDSLVWADRPLLGRAIANTVDNALRHNPPPARVTLAGQVEGRHLVVTVSDDGSGLPANVAATIALAGDTAELPTAIGSGIAATIGLVRVHGGTVNYPPVPIGTRCVITVPLEGH
jgi:K+-sensing histidine kinase KdpD